MVVVAGVVARRVAGGFEVSVPFGVAEEFVDALGLVGERLIGEVPLVLREVESALWDAGTPVGAEQADGLGMPQADAVAEYSAWVGAAEGLAVGGRANAFMAYVAGQQERRGRALGVWLDRYAEDFSAAAARWERGWVETLEEEFARQEGRAA